MRVGAMMGMRRKATEAVIGRKMGYPSVLWSSLIKSDLNVHITNRVQSTKYRIYKCFGGVSGTFGHVPLFLPYT